MPLLVEFCTYPEKRVVDQMMDDLMLVKQVRGVLPEGLALILCPKGEYMVPEKGEFTSVLGWSKGWLSWKVLPLWTLLAEQMLLCPDVGMVPWITMMHFTGSPEPLLRRCRERIDREGGKQRTNLLAVTQTLMRLRFSGKLLELFGGSQAMIESPLIQEIVEQADRKRQRKSVVDAIRVRFAPLSDIARVSLDMLNDENKLDDLFQFAITCKTLEAFLERLAKETALRQCRVPRDVRAKRELDSLIRPHPLATEVRRMDAAWGCGVSRQQSSLDNSPAFRFNPCRLQQGDMDANLLFLDACRYPGIVPLPERM